MPAHKKQSGGIRSFLVNSVHAGVHGCVYVPKNFMAVLVRSCIFWSPTTMPRPQEDGGWTGLVTAAVRNEKTKIHV